MKKILVPFDFSKPAINAYRFALDVASRSKGIVQLIHVIELPVLNHAGALSARAFEASLLKELEEDASSQFKTITEEYKSEGVNVTSTVAFGVPSKTIVEAIHRRDIDLVIMGSHGTSGLREYLIGSNAEKIIRKSSVPVLIIKNYFKGVIKNIVFPNALDKEDQKDLIKKIKALQQFFKAHLHVVWINTPLTFASDVITKQRLNAFASHNKLTDYTVNIFNYRNAEEGIIEFAKSVKGDIIAIGTHGRKGIAHLLNGSLAEDVANHANTLIWTYTLKNEPIEV